MCYGEAKSCVWIEKHLPQTRGFIQRVMRRPCLGSGVNCPASAAAARICTLDTLSASSGRQFRTSPLLSGAFLASV